MVDIICRGNLSWGGDCRLLTYFTRKLHMLKAGKALAGVQDTSAPVYAPDLKVIKDGKNNIIISNFCQRLFDSPVDALRRGATVGGFSGRDVCFSSHVQREDEGNQAHQSCYQAAR